MKRIKNQQRLNALLEKNHIPQYFKDPDLPFQLWRFEKGEYLNNALDPLEYISFVIYGTIRIIHIRDNGSMYEVTSGSGFTILGDHEFGLHRLSPYLVETLSDVLCISLPLVHCREKLENDPVFLRHLLKSMAEKITMLSGDLSEPSNLRERVLRYMKLQCPGMVLSGVEKVAHALGCSKRQLLRILRQLCEESIVTKTGKGKYQLEEPASDALTGCEL